MISFLIDLKLRVKQGNCISSEVNITAGVPQYSISISSDVKNQNIKLTQYADDLALWTSGVSSEKMERDMTRALEELSIVANKWGMKINPEKSQLSNFSRKQTIEILNIILDEKVLKQVPF